MQKVLTAAQMREVDRLTTQRCGIPSILLMENAAHAAARVIVREVGGTVHGKKVVLLCGKGNNGGDGAALARILWTMGADCFVHLFGSVAELNDDARTNFEVLKKICDSPGANSPDRNCLILYENAEFPDNIQPNEDVLVDALLGTGIDRPIKDALASIVQKQNTQFLRRRRRLFVSLDIPSGLSSDHGNAIGPHALADLTVTFTAPKPGNVLPPGQGSNGRLVVANIGSPPELIDGVSSQLYLAERSDAAKWLRAASFTASSYKNKRGHALMIAGSRNYTGAAVLCGNSAIRSGVGLVTLAVPEGSRDSVIARVAPEVMVRGISETKGGSAGGAAFDEVNGFLKNIDAVAVGSGLSSKEDETRDFIRRIVAERETPVVIDADGLTALSPFDIEGSANLPLILTPHEGEFMKLIGADNKAAIQDRVEAVTSFAVRHKVILVLKGERALIGGPDGRVVVNPTGNSGLGKAGNGDTLTGIITGFVAQAIQMKIDMFETVVAAVYIAGMAGDVAEKKFGKRVMTASDVRDSLVDVFDELSEK